MTLNDDGEASSLLLSHDWKMDRAFNWFSPTKNFSPDEETAIAYLINEWDYGYGGIIEKNTI